VQLTLLCKSSVAPCQTLIGVDSCAPMAEKRPGMIAIVIGAAIWIPLSAWMIWYAHVHKLYGRFW